MNIKKWQSHLILPFDLSTSSDVGGRGPKACETRDKVRSTRELDRSDSARIPDTGGKVARNYLRAVVSRTRHSRRGSTTLEPGNKCSSRFAKACTALHERRIHQFLFFLFFFIYRLVSLSIDQPCSPSEKKQPMAVTTRHVARENVFCRCFDERGILAILNAVFNKSPGWREANRCPLSRPLCLRLNWNGGGDLSRIFRSLLACFL